MSPFKSIFSSEKVINYESFPKPPTVREIEEDIENSVKDDPVYKFAKLLETIGKYLALSGPFLR